MRQDGLREEAEDADESSLLDLARNVRDGPLLLRRVRTALLRHRERSSDEHVRNGAIPTEAWVLPRPSRSKYVGSFPLHFEKRLWEVLGKPEKILQPFGGCAEIGDTVDLNPTVGATWVGDAHDLHWIDNDTYDAVILDPPYSDEEAEELYDTPPLKYGKFVKEAVRVCKPAGHVCIYHVKQAPRPAGTVLVRRIVVLTRTWHAARICMIYQKDARLTLGV